MFNINEIDSNSKYYLNIDRKNIHEETLNTVYFKNTNIYEIPKILNQLDVQVLSYVINDKKYYVNNIYELMTHVLKEKNNEDRIYYELNGFNIDAINIICENQELIKLEKIADIY